MNKVVTISTFAPGGIRSVVENYQSSESLKDYQGEWIHSHKNEARYLIALTFLQAVLKIISLRMRGYKLYHLHMAMKGSFYRKMILLLLLRIMFSKIVLHLHGSEFEHFYKRSSLLLKRLIRYTFETADTVIVLSNSWSKFVVGVAPDANVEVINNYVRPVPRVPQSEIEDKIYFVFLGALGKRKGIYDLLPAFKALLDQGINAKLIICGDGEMERAISLANRLELGGNVEFTGWVSGDEKIKKLNQADVVVLPSYNEGLPMVILEGMSLGKCIISTRVGGIPEVIENEENGLLIDAGNKEQLIGALSVTCQAEQRIQMGNAALKTYQQRYSPAHIIPKLQSIYDRYL